MTRVAIVGGCRTPFVKAGTSLARYSFLELGKHVVEATVRRLNLDPSGIDELAFSTVLLDPRTPNAARELILRSELPDSVGGHFVSNNCISGLVAAGMISEGIQSGRIRCGIAGGSESMSQPTLTFSKKAELFFLKLFTARTMGARLSTLASFRPGFLMPQPPSPKEPSTGLTMGQHCELMAKEFGVEREPQDLLALKSHQNAGQAQEKGYFAEEIEPLGKADRDNIIRPDTSIERLNKLRPVFDRSDAGTLTAGNSSALSDGASAVCLMSEEQARSENRQILGFLEAIEYASIDPKDGLLMAPGLALPKLLQKNGLTVGDIDFFEIHEAFSAQVIANQMVWKDGWEKYPELKPIGEIPDEKINVNGGSVAIGAPLCRDWREVNSCSGESVAPFAVKSGSYQCLCCGSHGRGGAYLTPVVGTLITSRSI